MPDSTALAIAAVFALLALLPLAGRAIFRPLAWLCLAAGVGAWFVAVEAPKIFWDEWLAPMTGYVSGSAALVFRAAIAAVVAELVKAVMPLLGVSVTPAGAVTGLAYGAAAGAGYGAALTLPDIGRTLELIGSPIVTPLSTAGALAGWAFLLVLHAATTGYVARAGVRGGLGAAFLVASLLQFIVGATQTAPLPIVAGVPVKVLVTMVIAAALFAYLWTWRVRAGGAAPTS